MSPREIIEQIAADGLTLSVSEDGNLKIVGDESAVNIWLKVIRECKQEILSELQSKKYVIRVTDASTDPVIVNVSIKGIGAFDMAIPHAHYDGLALLEVIEQHSLEAERKTGSNVYPFPDKRSVA
ncbi:hypothetical protein [Nitrosospira multiformis]|uniref:TubC N-terminal docking domain-containing protein n=1 Tax=Nitrosospira multiformis TaxID=1231 RepID=A0A1I7IXN5_9PROT|nr:hypothetical protein [Nitrosospira multiformis]SFU77723.1 hypothetical protein SAMN05216417_13112 [Nitrosospira multiformis]